MTKANGNGKKCYLCPRMCGVNRDKTSGACGMGNTARIALSMLHRWEEPIISGTRGSGAVFFSGCSLKCDYCQNYEVSHCGKGYYVSDRELSEIFRRLESEGAHNINLVTPAHFAENIIAALELYRPNIPICYNTGGYERVETLERLLPYVDIFLADMKYGVPELAAELSGARDYADACREAIKFMREAKPDIIEDGLMRQGLIIRHLVLPGELDNSLKVVKWLEECMPRATVVSLMNQFTPGLGNSRLTGRVKPIEYKILINRLLAAGFENAYIQEDGCSTDEYVPRFIGECLKPL